MAANGLAPLKILTFGTSLTNQNDWQADLGHRLTAAWERPVDVVKIAKGGMTSRWGLGQVAGVIAACPDIVLVEFLINDADLRRSVGLAESRSNHRTILSEIRQAMPQAQIFLMTMNPARGLRRWLLRPRMEAYNRLYRALAPSENVGLIDIAPLWRRGVDLPAAIPDGVHPTRDAVLSVTVPAIARALAQAVPA